MSNDELVRKITNIIRNHANPKQGLNNLKRNQNIVPGIVAIIKGGVGGQATTTALVKNVPVNDLVNSITKLIHNSVALPPPAKEVIVERLTTNGNQTNELVQKILQTLRSAIQPPVILNQNSKPEGAIGSAYYAGKKMGWVFGTQNAPMFKLKGNTEPVIEHKGWRLRGPRNTNAYNLYYTKTPRTPGTPWKWPSIFSRKNRMPVYGPEMKPNFLPPNTVGVNNNGRPKYTPPPPGYVLTTRNGQTGYFKNVNRPVVPTRVNNRNEIRRREILGRGVSTSNEIRRRREILNGGGNRRGVNMGGGNLRGVNTSGNNNLNEIRRRRVILSGEVPPPPLPPTQQNAINNAGGIPRALNTVAAVPGGAPAVAKAAEALNETGGNVAQAITIKGASPIAINAVQKLGGKNNAIHVLEGLNTMAQKPATRAMKRTRRPRKKSFRPRLAELNKVINSVKKKKLISIIAHNITKTHEIHPNDEKLKKYYRKVIKANILRTPFSKIVRKAAKK